MPVNVHRPKAIVFDILGTASKSGFLERILFPFLKINLESFVNTHWTKREFVRLYNKILEQSVEFQRQDPSTPIVASHESPQAKQSLMSFINYVTENGINSPAVTQLRFKVWFEGYQTQKIRTPIYSDVPNKIRVWFAEGIKFYVFSNTWVEAQKALLRNTNHGDLTNLISGHYDNDFGLLTEPDSWLRLCTAIRENPNDVLFLTKSVAEAKAAGDAGVAVVLVLTHRHNVKAVTREDRDRFPYVRTLNDLTWIEGSMNPPSEPPQPATLSHQPTPSAPGQATVPTAMSGPSGTMPLISTGQPAQASSGTTSTGTSGASGASGSSATRASSATSASGAAAAAAGRSHSHAGSSRQASGATSGSSAASPSVSRHSKAGASSRPSASAK